MAHRVILEGCMRFYGNKQRMQRPLSDLQKFIANTTLGSLKLQFGLDQQAYSWTNVTAPQTQGVRPVAPFIKPWRTASLQALEECFASSPVGLGGGRQEGGGGRVRQELPLSREG